MTWFGSAFCLAVTFAAVWVYIPGFHTADPCAEVLPRTAWATGRQQTWCSDQRQNIYRIKCYFQAHHVILRHLWQQKSKTCENISNDLPPGFHFHGDASHVEENWNMSPERNIFLSEVSVLDIFCQNFGPSYVDITVWKFPWYLQIISILQRRRDSFLCSAVSNTTVATATSYRPHASSRASRQFMFKLPAKANSKIWLTTPKCKIVMRTCCFVIKDRGQRS